MARRPKHAKHTLNISCVCPSCCRGPKAQLEEIMTELQHRLASIDGEKSDAATALACASLLQAEAAAAGGGKAGAAGSADAPSEAAAESDALEGSTHASLELLEWAEGVCSGAAAAVAQPAGAPAGEQAAEEALRWACFAAAAYGTRQHMWRRDDTSSCAARMQLSRLASAAAAEGAAPLAGWGGLGPASPDAAPAAAADGPARKPSRSERRSFAPARELLGPGCDIAAMSCGHEGSVLLPHLLALDRWAGRCFGRAGCGWSAAASVCGWPSLTCF